MGKAKKLKVSKKESVAPLEDQIKSGIFAAPTGRVKERPRLDEDENYVESRLSKSIITQARQQVISFVVMNIQMPWTVSGLLAIFKTRYIRGRASLVSVPSACLF